MSTKIQHSEQMTQDGIRLRLAYDEEADLMEIFFGENESATGIELTDHIVLRIHRESRRAVGLVLLHFSVLTQATEYGPRNFPLSGLEELPDDLRQLVLEIIGSRPVNGFLKLSHFQAPAGESIPLTYVEPIKAAA